MDHLLLQGSAVRKGTKLARLQLLFDEGAALPVNFDAELRPIRAAISAAKQWQEDNAPMLQRLLSASGAADQKPADAFDAESADATSVPAPATAGVKEETSSAAAQEDITLADLVNLAASAAQLVADFDSAR
jgi:predicted RNA-binding Zn ribbon-like protein